MNKKPIIIDCDPGHDDAMAIMWALSSDMLDVRAITCVAGNKSLEKVVNNTLRVLTKFGVTHIPVGVGAKKPLLRERLRGGGSVHGDSGIDGPELPDPGFDVSELSAFELMVKVLEEAEEPVTICPLGPLTNVAQLLIVRPDLKAKIERISLMGGGYVIGNWTPQAEFNILADPEAASTVFTCGVPVAMSGLDVTHKAYLNREDHRKLHESGTVGGKFAAELLDFYSHYHYEIEKLEGSTMHDPCAIAWLTNPEIFKTKRCYVDVECSGQYAVGKTVVDWYDVLGKPKHVDVLYDVDRDAFAHYFVEAMCKLN